MRHNPEESFEEARARRRLGRKGKSAESRVETILTGLRMDGQLDYDRLPDTRSAGRIMPARVSDFTLFFAGKAASLEVKEMKVKKKGPNIRLNIKSGFPQFPRMLLRERTGCLGYLLVHNVEMVLWVMVPVTLLPRGVKSFHMDTLIKMGRTGRPEELIKELVTNDTYF